MTGQAFAERMQAKAAEYLKAYDTTRQFVVARCEHHTVKDVALWLFENTSQIAAVSEAPGERWRAARMHGGLPYAERTFDQLTDALEFAIEGKL